MSFDSNYDVNTIKPWDTTPSVFENSCPVQQRSYSPLWQMSEIPICSSVVSISLICINKDMNQYSYHKYTHTLHATIVWPQT